jgi:hypothetical protein
MFDENPLAARKVQQESTKWRGTNEALNFGSNGIASRHGRSR